VQQARENNDAALQEFRAKAANLSSQIKTEFDTQIAHFQKSSDLDSGKVSAEFRAALKLQVQDELSGARKELQVQLEAARQELSLQLHSQQQTLADNAAALSENAIEEYRRKLDAASNSWLLTTVAKLSQQTDQHVEMLTKAAEERLRAACTEVFSGVGDALRRGLLDVDLPPGLPEKGDE
jgi:chromosome condensin MukBEF complex kleisin-like MukF subunit